MSGMMRKALGRGAAAKISICVPSRDTVHAAFAFDLAKMVQHCTIMGVEVVLHFCIGTLIVNQRDQLAEMANIRDTVVEASIATAVVMEADDADNKKKKKKKKKK